MSPPKICILNPRSWAHRATGAVSQYLQKLRGGTRSLGMSPLKGTSESWLPFCFPDIVNGQSFTTCPPPNIHVPTTKAQKLRPPGPGRQVNASPPACKVIISAFVPVVGSWHLTVTIQSEASDPLFLTHWVTLFLSGVCVSVLGD